MDSSQSWEREKVSKSGQNSKMSTPKALGTDRDYRETDLPNPSNEVLATHHDIS